MTLENRAIEALRKMQEVTKVLGKGIGNITTPDGFFALWNEAEMEASSILASAREQETEDQAFVASIGKDVTND